MKIQIGEHFLNISESNSKMGKIPSFSLPAITTCRPDAPCKKECYQQRFQKRYLATIKTYQENHAILKAGLHDTVQSLIGMYLKLTGQKYFRWNVAGDFNTKGYFNMAVKVQEQNPNVHFMQFTKCYEYAERKRPKNFHLILSGWREHLIPPKNNATSDLIYSEDEVQDKSLICRNEYGDFITCDKCLRCFHAKKDFRVYFIKH